MRAALFFLLGILACSCDRNRLYEQNQDFEERSWLITEKPEFTFEIRDTTKSYNIYCNLRNSLEYPLSRIFINYSLQDSSRNNLKAEMISVFIFEEKTGKPFGSSGLGNVYDHQVPVVKNYSFARPGVYTLNFQQFMRVDTLQGILAVGFRVETAGINE